MFPDRQGDRHGVLAVRRVVDVRLGVLLPRRARRDRALDFVGGSDMAPWQFLVLCAGRSSSYLGWPLEWSEILIIFVPIFLPTAR